MPPGHPAAGPLSIELIGCRDGLCFGRAPANAGYGGLGDPSQRRMSYWESIRIVVTSRIEGPERNERRRLRPASAGDIVHM